MLPRARLCSARASVTRKVCSMPLGHSAACPLAVSSRPCVPERRRMSSTASASEAVQKLVGADAAAQQSRRARKAFAEMSIASVEKRNQCLAEFEAQLASREQEIYDANERDMKKEAARGGPTGRLSLKGKIGSLIEGLQQIRAMPDLLGRVTMSRSLSDGLNLFRTSTPLGVLLIIFEARPDAAVQIFSLAMKTGNTLILKGGSEATETLLVLADAMQKSLAAAGLPENASQLVIGRDAVAALLGHGLVDLVIPRGSNDLVKMIQETTTTPVLGHADGICHVFVDEAADLKMACSVIRDAKTNYPQACNAVETVLVHKNVAEALLPLLAEALHDCKIHACPRSFAILGDKAVQGCEQDYRTEWGVLTLSMRIVDSQAEAIDHIREYASGHTDVIVTEDTQRADDFVRSVNSAGVYVNASTRFADGFRYGFGAEVGISTSKIHARGPVGLEGLLSYKYQVYGQGHTVGGDTPTTLKHTDFQGVPMAADIRNSLDSELRADLLKAKRILVKVGSSVVTRSDGKGLALARFANLVEQLAQLVASGREVVLVSSGGVSIGRGRVSQAADQQRARGEESELPIPSQPLPRILAPKEIEPVSAEEKKRQASAAGQSKIMGLYENMFGVYDTHVAQILITIPDLEYAKPRQLSCRTIEGLMRQGIVPIVNENDALAYEPADGDGSINKDELPITDNDSIAAVLAVELGCDLVVLLSEVDGVYPSMQDRTVIPIFTEASLQESSVQYGATSGVGRGGMDSKVRAAAYMMRRGVQVVICNGMKTNTTRTLLDVVGGKNVGTLFAPER